MSEGHRSQPSGHNQRIAEKNTTATERSRPTTNLVRWMLRHGRANVPKASKGAKIDSSTDDAKGNTPSNE
ncbi:hypothetical protein BBBOND_0209260 [Babesia bigemina]|uniref:Uncharacterized protein n=1 Tax=Babesia bigemina TaxID=5866 RepID=A0A061D5E0_BABBI|nr:hypothetical protein BBBOND_0209260 [Babesia bigemina]CDR95773.1 hypothetical protein BBBOND_0209260 [Babesia bigemina]|eukprot:XP_012767959.1 hypothetical protein BBBOND_0209260 [Babesia bigemina]